MSLYWLFLFCIVSYFIGNINFAVIITRRARLRDIRQMGSGNPGATNMLRQYGFKLGILNFILDVCKGVIPALVGVIAFGGWNTPYGQIALYACGLAAVLGHCFPVIYKFKGGKGVSSIVGVFMVANPLFTLGIIVVVGVYWAAFEYGAISSIVLITFMVIVQGLGIDPDSYGSVAIVSMLVGLYFFAIFTHRTNVKRLLSGKENHASLLRKLKRKKLECRQEIWKQEVTESN